MKKALIIAMIVVVGLLGCNSFNRIQNPASSSVVKEPTRAELYESYWQTFMSSQQPDDADGSLAYESNRIEPSAPGTCAVFKMPSFPPPPVFPYKEFQNLKPKDFDGASAIERKHMQNLADYIFKYRSQVLRAHVAYLSKCRSEQLEQTKKIQKPAAADKK
jgi:uncharacterized lipoprotein NlpE involved in copper resistance